jgi:glycosyltransferase involved in cell wall biosynthesis
VAEKSSAPRERVHLAVYSESTFVGGGEKLLATLIEGLEDRIEVTVIATDPAVGEEIATARPGSRLRVIDPVRGRRDVAGMVAHLRLVRELRPDVLQTNGNPWVCQYAVAAGVLTPGVKTVALHHIMPPPTSRGQLWRNRWSLRRVDAHVCVFSAGARRLEEWIGLPEGTVRTIHNGMPDFSVDPRPRVADGAVIGNVGRLEWQKGQDVLVRAMPELPGVTAVLVGDGGERDTFADLARELGVADRVRMPGWQQDPRAWLAGFDALVMPSRAEGLPLVIIEAMLASRPVVATSVDGIPELVAEGRTGRLVPPDDPPAFAAAVRSVLDDPARAERMGAEAREVALREFSVEAMVRSYEALYRELCP